jgi:four helix bundle protein
VQGSRLKAIVQDVETARGLNSLPPMKYDSDREWRERSFRFACKLFDYCDEIGQRPGPARRLSYQLFDSGSSIGANLAESQASYSRRELGSKDAIALKESKETKLIPVRSHQSLEAVPYNSCFRLIMRFLGRLKLLLLLLCLAP